MKKEAFLQSFHTLLCTKDRRGKEKIYTHLLMFIEREWEEE